MAASLQDIRDMSAYWLANVAGCMCPDATDSAGAEFLLRVRDDIVELLDDETVNLDALDRIDNNGAIHEIADNAPSVYTHTCWQQFVDLGAYQEEPETGEWPEDLTRAAMIALYQVAQNLCYAVIAEYREHLEQVAEEDDEIEPLTVR